VKFVSLSPQPAQQKQYGRAGVSRISLCRASSMDVQGGITFHRNRNEIQDTGMLVNMQGVSQSFACSVDVQNVPYIYLFKMLECRTARRPVSPVPE
jgi:hypothetical protein